MHSNVAQSLDLRHAKRAMKITILKVWLCDLAMVAAGSFLLLVFPQDSDFHVSDVHQLPGLWVWGGVFVYLPALYIGRRRWIRSDAANFWKNPAEVVDRIEQLASVKTGPNTLGPIFLTPLFWFNMWSFYWSERTAAVEARQRGMESSVESISRLPEGYNAASGKGALFRAKLDGSNAFYRSLTWREIIVAVIGIVAVLPLLISVFQPLGDWLATVQMNHEMSHRWW